MHTNIIIQNLKCGGCENTILKNLLKIEGVSNVGIETSTSIVSLEYANESLLKTAKQTLTKLGYPPSEEVNKISLKAKSYVSCAIGRIVK